MASAHLNTALGHVDRLIVAPEDGRITHAVVSKGLLRHDYPVIPVGMVEEVAEGDVLIVSPVMK